MEQFGDRYISAIETKVESLDSRVAQISENVEKVLESSTIMNNIQHHFKAWTDLTNSIDKKIDYMQRYRTINFNNFDVYKT